MPYKSVLVVSDNEPILKAFVSQITEDATLAQDRSFRFACHPKHAALANKKIGDYRIEPLSLKVDPGAITEAHDLVISAHCKQIFPDALVNNVKCVNIHPGYNPYNRGWYPQVFSILNGLPLGATIHEIDVELDHGGIIARREVTLEAADTSLTAYNKVHLAELELMKEYLGRILGGTYTTRAPEQEGNINFRKDFDELREIKRDQQATYGEVIDRMRALSHPPFKNAFFVDSKTNRRVWLTLSLEEEEEESADEK